MITSEMEKDLKYVTNCIKESQRLIPVITGFSRGAVGDTELGGKLLCFQKKVMLIFTSSGYIFFMEIIFRPLLEPVK